MWSPRQSEVWHRTSIRFAFLRFYLHQIAKYLQANDCCLFFRAALLHWRVEWSFSNLVARRQSPEAGQVSHPMHDGEEKSSHYLLWTSEGAVLRCFLGGENHAERCDSFVAFESLLPVFRPMQALTCRDSPSNALGCGTLKADCSSPDTARALAIACRS